MKNTDNLTLVKEKAQQWLEGSYDEKTKEQVKYLLQNDEKDLVESFYKDLEFGTDIMQAFTSEIYKLNSENREVYRIVLVQRLKIIMTDAFR